MRSPLSRLSLVPLIGLVVLASACSSPAPKAKAIPKTTTNTGLCKLVVPSVVATALEQSVNYPVTLTHGATTECAYPGIHSTSTAVIIRYDAGVSSDDFARTRTSFERRGLKLGPISGLGDQAYYFATKAGGSTVTTVVLQRDTCRFWSRVRQPSIAIGSMHVTHCRNTKRPTQRLLHLVECHPAVTAFTGGPIVPSWR